MKKLTLFLITLALLSSIFTVSGNGNENVTEPSFITYGDVNGDGSVKLSDASVLLKHIAKWNVSINTKAADVTNDGILSLSDVSQILKYIAKWDVTLGPSGDDSITADNLLNHIRGYWIHRSYNGYNYVYDFLSFDNTTLGGGRYLSEYNRPGIIKNVKEVENGKYELQILYPEHQYYDSILPETTGTMTIFSTDNFKSNFTEVNSKGEHIQWLYAGKTLEDCILMIETLIRIDNVSGT